MHGNQEGNIHRVFHLRLYIFLKREGTKGTINNYKSKTNPDMIDIMGLES